MMPTALPPAVSHFHATLRFTQALLFSGFRRSTAVVRRHTFR